MYENTCVHTLILMFDLDSHTAINFLKYVFWIDRIMKVNSGG